MTKNLSPKSIDKALTRLADPDVNIEIDIASTVDVAKDVIRTLPGIRRLRRNEPEVARIVLDLLRQTKRREDENFTSIALYILEAYPSEDLKLALAKPIVERRFKGFNLFLAAEAFLKAAGIHAKRKDVIATALREAGKIVGKGPAKLRPTQRPTTRTPKAKKKARTAVKK